ncbi:MAG: sodium-dependent transporter [Gammaproteobacteria bacterium]|nr:sodium-dependent transporter [Gammaproteobacteria bacterium]
MSSHLAVIAAAVGLGSVWRFPYLAGSHGGAVFILAFAAALFLIAAPLLVAEYLIGRSGRSPPPTAAGTVAARFGASTRWNAIGQLGTWTALIIMSYYTIIAGWVLAYAWYCASGHLTALTRGEVAPFFRHFLAQPLVIGFWHLIYLGLVALISGCGLTRGIELTARVRGPMLLALLLLLIAYALSVGDVARGLSFAFAPHLASLSARTLLVATGQAFFATGVGMGMMLAYGAYMPERVSVLRSALLVCGALLLVSLLASVLIFPLVFAYGLSPAQGPELVFNVLPIAFAEMPAGRLVGSVFFVLLLVSALTPSIAGLEPLVAWLQQSRRLSRAAAATLGCALLWLMGLASLLSFNLWADWHPLAIIPAFHAANLFDVLDFVSSNLLLTAGAALTCLFVGWRLPRAFIDSELRGTTPQTRRLLLLLLRYVSSSGIAAVLLTALL